MNSHVVLKNWRSLIVSHHLDRHGHRADTAPYKFKDCQETHCTSSH
jgi:hypothetical protein